MKKIYVIFLVVFSSPSVAQSLLFQNGIVPEMPPTSKVMAAYMEIKNLTDEDITINKFSSIDFKNVELHKTSIKNNIAKMLPQKSITIPAHNSVKLAQGGLHLMLSTPKKWFKAGDLVQLEIMETNKTKHIIEISVKKYDHSHHH